MTRYHPKTIYCKNKLSQRFRTTPRGLPTFATVRLVNKFLSRLNYFKDFFAVSGEGNVASAQACPLPFADVRRGNPLLKEVGGIDEKKICSFL